MEAFWILYIWMVSLQRSRIVLYIKQKTDRFLKSQKSFLKLSVSRVCLGLSVYSTIHQSRLLRETKFGEKV